MSLFQNNNKFFIKELFVNNYSFPQKLNCRASVLILNVISLLIIMLLYKHITFLLQNSFKEIQLFNYELTQVYNKENVE